MRSNVIMNISPVEYEVLKQAIENYEKSLDIMENKELGYEADKRIGAERRLIERIKIELDIE